MQQLQGKVAIITGGGRGVGRSMAFALAAEGVKVAVAARTVEQIEDVASKINSAGGTAVAIRADVSVEDDIKRLVREAEAALGPTDLLVNNAAILPLAPVAQTPTDAWDQAMNINVRAIFLACKEVLPGMIERRAGRIINIGSMAGRRGYTEQGAYCASKHALVGLSKVLALETQAYGIRVHVLSPGGVLTELSADLRRSRGAVEDSEWMTTEEVAHAVLYLCSQTGAAMTDDLVLRRYESEPWR